MFFSSNDISFNVIAAFGLNWQNRNDNPEIRPYPVLSFRKTGSAHISYKNNSYFLGAGEILFIPAYCNYKIQSEYEDLIAIHFCTDKPLPKEIKTFKPKSPQYLEKKFDALLEEWSQKQYGYSYECKSLMYKIVSTIERELLETKLINNDDKISKAVEYIHENFLNDAFSIKTLADMCTMSDTYFRKLFFKRFSVTPRKYINNLKLNYALDLLHSKYYTVQEVSDKCGFENVFYFSNFIKKETGKSPIKHI